MGEGWDEALWPGKVSHVPRSAERILLTFPGSMRRAVPNC